MHTSLKPCLFKHTEKKNTHTDLDITYADLDTTYADLDTTNADLDTTYADLDTTYAIHCTVNMKNKCSKYCTYMISVYRRNKTLYS